MAPVGPPAAQSPSPPLSSPVFPIEASRRHLYCRREMEVLASNNSACLFDGGFEPYLPKKTISTVSNADFEALFPQAIQPRVLDYLGETPLSHASWSLHVFRMGFAAALDNPIVIHLLVDRDLLTTDDACGLVTRIASAISAAQWRGEKYAHSSLSHRESSLTHINAKQNLYRRLPKSPEFSSTTT